MSKYNVRINVDIEAVKKLSQNIELNGLLNPLVVRPEPPGYGIVCGRMRYLAIKLLKERDEERYYELFPRGIPCVVRELSPREAMLLSLSENLRQNTMTRDEIGRAIEILKEKFGLSENEIQRRLQLMSEEIYYALKVWRALKTAVSVSRAKPARPGRPRKETKVEAEHEKRGTSRTAATIVYSIARKIKEKSGVEESEEELAKKIMDLTEGLSIKEIELVSDRISREPGMLKNGMRGVARVVEEVKRKRYVSRVVAFSFYAKEMVERYARQHGLSFDEAVNKIIEEYFSRS